MIRKETPNAATHIYYGTKRPTLYQVFEENMWWHESVYFWDVYRKKWVKSYCHPSVKKMTEINNIDIKEFA